MTVLTEEIDITENLGCLHMGTASGEGRGLHFSFAFKGDDHVSSETCHAQLYTKQVESARNISSCSLAFPKPLQISFKNRKEKWAGDKVAQQGRPLPEEQGSGSAWKQDTLRKKIGTPDGLENGYSEALCGPVFRTRGDLGSKGTSGVENPELGGKQEQVWLQQVCS